MPCATPSCTLAALPNKAHCLTHHKDQSNYTYGLDYEIQQKILAKWDIQKANICLQWLHNTIQTKYNNITTPIEFNNELKDGILLCQVLIKLYPNLTNNIPYKKSNMPFIQRENITLFLNNSKKIGLKETDCFMTNDLYESQNLISVCDCIIALSRLSNNNNNNNNNNSIQVGRGTIMTDSIVAPVNAPIDISLTACISPQSVATTAAKVVTQVCACGSARVNGAKFCGQCGKAY